MPDFFSLFKRSTPSPHPADDLDMDTKATSGRKTIRNGGHASTSSGLNGVVDAFGCLSLGNGSRDGRTVYRPSEVFVGGFASHSHTNHVPTHAVPLGTPKVAFPEPKRYPAPGSLPRPPIPQMSRTMEYVLRGDLPLPPAKDRLRPPPMVRPHSDSGLFSSSSRLQAPLGTPQRPAPLQAPNPAPAKPVSSVHTSRPAPLQTPTKRPRAASSPPSPTSSSKGGPKVQCSGVTKLDKRCTRMVAITVPLSRLNGEDLPHYCHQHLKIAFVDTKFVSHKEPHVEVSFDEWIPEYLQQETQELLRLEMRTKRSDADVSGYIYGFQIDDPTNPTVIHFKVGRTVKLVKRLAEWDQQCQSKETHLRGFWPTTADAERGNLGRGRVQVGEPGPWHHKVERLVHLELADLALNAPYLDPDYPNVKGGNGKGRFVDKTPCPDCGRVHHEIFSFRRGEGRYQGREWQEIVKPVIEKWGGFVEAYV